MPRDPFKPLTAQEQSFVFHWVREKCLMERMGIVERKAKVPQGKGILILARPHVQRDIDARKYLVELESARLIARDQNRADTVQERKEKVTLDRIETVLHDLMNLDLKEQGALVHAAVQTALVYSGVVRKGNFERTIPLKDPSGDPDNLAGSGVYSSIFSDMHDHASGGRVPPEQAPAPLHPSEKPLPLPVAPMPAPQRPPAPAKAVPAGPTKTIDIEIS